MAKELYVGHLPFEATTEDLRKLFSVAGTVTSVHIITDPETGKSKGCGYVRMASEEQLKEAIECLDGALMENRVITVSMANPQKTQTKPLSRSPGNTQPGSRRARARQR
jgi:RNA recognition motif-containing protein